MPLSYRQRAQLADIRRLAKRLECAECPPRKRALGREILALLRDMLRVGGSIDHSPRPPP